MSSVDANPRRASLRLTAAGSTVCRIETFVVRIARELSAAGLDARELASFRQCLDKLELRPGKRIRAYNWEKFLSDCSRSALAVEPVSHGSDQNHRPSMDERRKLTII